MKCSIAYDVAARLGWYCGIAGYLEILTIRFSIQKIQTLLFLLDKYRAVVLRMYFKSVVSNWSSHGDQICS